MDAIDLRMALAAASAAEDWGCCASLVHLLLSSREWDEDTKVSLSRKLLVYRELAA